MFEVWPTEKDEVCEPVYVPPVPKSVVSPVAGPAASAAVGSSNSVRAPIPGVILSIQVKVGDAVKTGQELCVLEAMKMKNAIRANRNGVIAAIHVLPGQTVQHGHALMDFGD
jgi:biotin carboxyl carrier protein